MTLRVSRFPTVLLATIALSSVPMLGQAAHSIPAPQANSPQSPFGGSVVEDIVARVNDQIISKSDYDRALADLEQQARQQNWSPQALEDQKKNLLRDLVDQQLLLSKGKELGITGETELVKQLDAIRKQNHLDSMEALESAAKEQGVSFEDFKQHIRDRIITQQVIGQEVYRKVNITQGELQRYYDAHQADFNKPETVRLSEILIGTPAADDAAQVSAAQAKADDMEAKLKSGTNFDELAKSASSGPTAAQGGDLGEFKRGQLAKVLEDQTFALQAGQYTQPIRTKQGFVILKVIAHNPGGQQTLKEVLPQVEEAVGAQRMDPALRAYLKQLRMEAYIDYKPGYVDTAAVVNPSKPVYSAYTPPAPKKKKKIERTRFRQKAPSRGSRTQTASAPAAPPNIPSLAQVPGATAAASTAGSTNATSGQVASGEDQVQVSNPALTASTPPSTSNKKAPPQVASSQKPGKKEKIRFGQAPRETLPATTATQDINAGANPAVATTPEQETQVASNADVPAAPAAPAEKKSRFSDRAKIARPKKAKGPQVDPFAPPPITSEEVATQKTQSAPLGLAGDTSKTAKPKPTEKTRMQDQLKQKNGTAPSSPSADQNAPAQTPPANTAPAPGGTQPQ